jgi:hypothetical protein
LLSWQTACWRREAGRSSLSQSQGVLLSSERLCERIVRPYAALHVIGFGGCGVKLPFASSWNIFLNPELFSKVVTSDPCSERAWQQSSAPEMGSPVTRRFFYSKYNCCRQIQRTFRVSREASFSQFNRTARSPSNPRYRCNDVMGWPQSLRNPYFACDGHGKRLQSVVLTRSASPTPSSTRSKPK